MFHDGYYHLEDDNVVMTLGEWGKLNHLQIKSSQKIYLNIILTDQHLDQLRHTLTFTEKEMKKMSELE